jgi:hypothetical protein
MCAARKNKKIFGRKDRGKIPRNGHEVEREHCFLRLYKSSCRDRASASGGRDTFQDSDIKYKWVTPRTRIGILAEFLREQQIDVMFVQEVIHSVLDNIWGYTAYTKLWTTWQGQHS